VVDRVWGGGLYANYAFGLLWAADASWWWLQPDGYRRRPDGLEAAVQGFLGFMAFNATVVFGAGAVRWDGLGAGLGLLGLEAAAWYLRGRRRWPRVPLSGKPTPGSPAPTSTVAGLPPHAAVLDRPVTRGDDVPAGSPARPVRARAGREDRRA
jgi:hypothetical protein